MSLKSTLNQIIKDRQGEVFTLNELEAFCHKSQYKLSNAERRLRKSESPLISPVWNDKRTAIVGYRYVDTTAPQPQIQPSQPNTTLPDWFFKPTIKKEEIKLF